MVYDLAVIGGGPAGMVAAGRAGERGARVLLLEKNDSLGMKLLATGNGRCNLSNMSVSDKQGLVVYGANHKFLFSAFNLFGVTETLEFFSRLGLETKVEDRGRIFPVSDSALDVRQVLIEYLNKNNVEIKFGAGVKELVANDDKIEKMVMFGGKEILAKNFLLATGGKSYPTTGSTGDGFAWLSILGYTINKLRPALAPLVVKEEFVNELEGQSVEDVRLRLIQNKKMITDSRGDIIFTADGISGPVAIDLSGQVSLALLSGPLTTEIDLLPKISESELDQQLQKDFHQINNKTLKNYLNKFVSAKMVSVLLEQCGIDEMKKTSDVTREERKRIIDILKAFALKLKGTKDFDKAMLTAGGLDVKALDPKTMRSKLHKNLYVAGEILDIDGPSGGYNLQLCWTTGFVAGESVIF